MIEFFMAMHVPTATHQEKQVAVIGGRPRFYEGSRLRDARQKLMAHLGRHRPPGPLEGPLRLVAKWIFPASKTHPANTWKATRPDTDNLAKLLKDCMTDEGFWTDDAQVASELVEKFHGDVEGIYVRVEELQGAQEAAGAAKNA